MMYRNPNLDDSPCSSDDDNPWSKFRRHSRTVNWNQYTDVKSLSHSEVLEETSDEYLHNAYRRKLFSDNSDDANIADEDDNGNVQTNDTYIDTLENEDDSMVTDGGDEQNASQISIIVGNRRTPRYTVPWEVDETMDVQFALECSIEGCRCTENWLAHREMLHAMHYHHHNDNYSGNALPDNNSDTSDPQWVPESNDYGSSIRHTTCTVKSCMCQQNEWSPFVHHGSSTRVVSEDDRASMDRSSSTDSFEVIEWAQGDSAELYLDTDKGNYDTTTHDDYNTPKTSPILDLSGLDGYHTAPNSPTPSLTEEFCIVETCHENATNHALLDTNSDVSDDRQYTHGDTRITEVKAADIHSDQGDIINAKGEGQEGQAKNNKCSKCNMKMTEAGKLKTGEVKEISNNTVSSDEFEANLKSDKQKEREQTNATISDAHCHQEPHSNQSRYTYQDPRILTLETPPFVYYNNLNYEGNPATGEAKVVGKGSFGVVYKARFSDPGFYHLPIVVKEFNDEYSSTTDIFDEAKRLYYLQDTGYVPICYGILKYSEKGRYRFGIVQELVGTGLTLEQMLWDRYELPMENWYRIALQSCEGLARFHEKGILLNDIKSNNILLEFSGRNVRIRYIDFGLATDMRGKRYKNTKSLEEFVYLAPEVRLKGGVTNIASDIYSLGYMINQIRKYSGMHEMSIVANLCMDIDPDVRLPVRGAASLLRDQMASFNLMNSRLDN